MSDDFAREIAKLRRDTGQRAYTHAVTQTGALRKATNHLGLRADLARKLEGIGRADLTDDEIRELLRATGLSRAEQIELIDELLS